MAVEETNFPYYVASRITQPQAMSQSLPTRGSHFSYFGSSLSSQIFLDLSPTSHVKPDPGFINYLAKKSKFPIKNETITRDNASPEPSFDQFTSWAQPLYLEDSVCNEEVVEYSNSFPKFTFLFDQLPKESEHDLAERVKTLSGHVEATLNDKVTHIVTTRSTQEVKAFIGMMGTEARCQPSNGLEEESTELQTLLRRLQKQGVKLWSLNKMNLVLDQLAPKAQVANDSAGHVEVEPAYFNNLFLLVEDATSEHRPIMADDIIVPVDLGSRSPVWDFVIRENPEWTHLLPEDNVPVKKRSKAPRKHKNGKAAAGKLTKLIKPKKKPAVAKKTKRGYCENCNTLFECMEEHLQEPTHQQLSRDYSRYEDLDSVISGVQRIVIS
ncbi:hypothetical protein K493DRAFT_337751 [Basidiobolus meristosporus CBS 931.73]|uniref:DBF4-type domain-containing protein n=1 Tax=Basidiobolus meristosporus CBS 931.73 TaxID=1314790 RepID=A0A1Y1Y9D0_9FUNG|nr:hypothetical protein K493DRAFT_337751 [Basidiobolus meristosporus CBS 931.73]|eukprot:ORX94593.1 hypothetical protein K493DRAFT_337751 [Basidiobolus meristosporus CBS 931.73]